MMRLLRPHTWWRRLSLGKQLILSIAAVGILAILLNSILLGSFLHHYLLERQGQQMAQQASALANCCNNNIRNLLLQAPASSREQLIQTALAGTPDRHALIVNTTGTLIYASPMSETVTQMLLARAQHDLSAHPADIKTEWYTLHHRLIAETSFSTNINNSSHQGILLLDEDQEILEGPWSSILGSVLLSGGMALALVFFVGTVAGQALAQPIRELTRAVHAISAGEYDHRVHPAGPIELHTLAIAFNAMVEEVQRQRQAERDLIANISHELAAPLGLMRGYAEALADDIITDTAQRVTALQAISAETLRLSRLSGDLLDLALLETGQISLQIEAVPIAELLRGIVARFTPLAQQAGIILSLEIPTILPAITTDGLRLEQVLVNLVNNALKHTPADGSITMHAWIDKILYIQVIDTGRGIPSEALARIWERFYRADAKDDRRAIAASVGLGLTISHSIMTLLGGDITVESVIDQGTTFTITLPIMKE
jgi:signal transduction histidine kinase